MIPERSEEDIAQDLRAPQMLHVIVLRDESVVRSEYSEKPARMLRRYVSDSFSGDSDPEEDNGAELLLKAEDFVKNRKKSLHDKAIKAALPLLAR